MFSRVSDIPLTVWKVSKYKVFSGLYFPVFSEKTVKYGLVVFRFAKTFKKIPQLAVLHKATYGYQSHVKTTDN